jgi:hypothetical protein
MGGWGEKAREMVGDVNVKVKVKKVRFGKENENRETDDSQTVRSQEGKQKE